VKPFAAFPRRTHSWQIRHYGALKDALLNDSVPEPKKVNGVDQFIEQIRAAGLPMALASSASRSRVELVLIAST